MLKGATPTLRAAVAYNSDRGSARLCSASVGTLCARDQERIGIADTTTPQVPLSPLSHSDSQNDSHRGRSAAIPTSARSRFPPFVRLDAPSLCAAASFPIRGCGVVMADQLCSCDCTPISLRCSGLQRLQLRLTYEAYMHPKRATRTMLCSFKITFARCLAVLRKRPEASSLGSSAAFSRAASKPLANGIPDLLCASSDGTDGQCHVGSADRSCEPILSNVKAETIATFASNQPLAFEPIASSTLNKSTIAQRAPAHSRQSQLRSASRSFIFWRGQHVAARSIGTLTTQSLR